MRLLGAVLSMMMVFACSVAQANHFKGRDNAHLLFFSAGRCSGTAIGTQSILTATHCLTAKSKDKDGKVKEDILQKIDDRMAEVVIRLDDGHDHTILITNLTFSTWAKFSTPAAIGDQIYYWGAPGNFDILLRTGTVVGIDNDHGTVQVVDINGWFGDSGAGVLDAKGNIVGVLSLVYVETEDNEEGSLKFSGMFPMTFTADQLKQIK